MVFLRRKKQLVRAVGPFIVQGLPALCAFLYVDWPRVTSGWDPRWEAFVITSTFVFAAFSGILAIVSLLGEVTGFNEWIHDWWKMRSCPRVGRFFRQWPMSLLIGEMLVIASVGYIAVLCLAA